MRLGTLVAALVLAVLAAPCAGQTPAGDKPDRYSGHKNEDWLRLLDPMVVETMRAYNAEDHRAFYRFFHGSMSGTATKQAFENVYVNGAKATAGSFLGRRKVLHGRSSFNEEAPLILYKAKFEKGIFRLSVNFKKSGDVYRILQLRVDSWP